MLFSPPAIAQDAAFETPLSKADSAFREGRFDAAERLSRQAFHEVRGQAGLATQETIGALSLLARSLLAQGRGAEALALLVDVVPRLEAALGPDNLLTLKVVSLASEAFEATGDIAQAAEYSAWAALGRQDALGPDHPDTLASSGDTALLLDKMGETGTAVVVLTDVVARSVAVLGPDAPETMDRQASLAGLLDRLGRYADAEPIHAQLVARSERLLGPADPLTLARKLDQARDLIFLIRPRDAEPLLRDVLSHHPAGFAPSDAASMDARAMLAKALAALGQMDEALALVTDSLRYQREKSGVDDPSLIEPLGNYAALLIGLDRLDEARAANAERLRIARLALPDGHKDFAYIKQSNADILVRGGKLHEAMALQREAVALLEAALGADAFPVLAARIKLAQLVGHTESFDKADREHRKAVRIVTQRLISPAHPMVQEANANYADFLLRNGKAPEALALLERNAANAERVYGPDTLQAAIASEKLARALVGLKRPIEALRHARKSLATRSVLAARSIAATGYDATDNYAAQSAWSNGQLLQKILTYSDATLAQYGLSRAGLVDEAFRDAQLQGADIAGRAIRRAAARSSANNHGLGALVESWETAQKARSEADAAFAGIVTGAGRPSQDLSEVVEMRHSLGAQIASLEKNLSALAPEFAELVAPRPVSLQELRQGAFLKADEALVILAPHPGADDHPGHVWAVTNDTVRYAPLAVRADALARQVGRFHAMLGRRASPGVRAPVQPQGASSALTLPFDFHLASQIYAELFGDPAIAGLLASKQTWIIAPQGSLLSLPFAALLSEPSPDAPVTAQSLRDAKWLGTQRNLAIVPSVSALKMLRSPARRDRTGSARLAYLGIGDPLFGGAPGPFRGMDADALRSAKTRRAAVLALPGLPGTAREIAALQKAFGAQGALTLTGADATERRLAAWSANGTLARAKIVHFATHGLLAGSLSELAEPALALTPPAADVARIGPWQTDDGLLLASEISQLRLNADWVLLSACNTAAGDRPDAQGLSGLARAFFFAGARALLVTHWAVEDAVAARLMANTVLHAQGAVSRAQALRAAMTGVMADTSRDDTAMPMSHPSIWAPFQLVGAPD